MDDESTFGELNELLVFGERLKLLANLQATYLDELRGHGFDDEQAFSLVRDWSQRGFDWTMRWVPAPAALDSELVDVAETTHDPSVAGSEGPYLLPYDDEQAA